MELPAWIGLGIVLATSLTLLAVRYRTSALLSKEEGLIPIHTDRTTVIVDGGDVLFPNTRVSVYRNFIVVASLRRSYVIDYTDITGVHYSRSSFGTNLTISTRENPSTIEFMTSNPTAILRELPPGLVQPKSLGL